MIHIRYDMHVYVVLHKRYYSRFTHIFVFQLLCNATLQIVLFNNLVELYKLSYLVT